METKVDANKEYEEQVVASNNYKLREKAFVKAQEDYADSHCGICGIETDWIVDFRTMVCPGCRDKHVDSGLLPLIGKLNQIIDYKNLLIFRLENKDATPCKGVHYL